MAHPAVSCLVVLSNGRTPNDLVALQTLWRPTGATLPTLLRRRPEKLMSLVKRVAEEISEWREDGETKSYGFAQAALEALGLVTCQACNATGVLCGHTAHEATNGLDGIDPCPICDVCHGLGVVPSEAMIERAAEAWAMADRPHARPLSIPWERLNPGLKRQYRSRMAAALLEAFGGDE